MTAVEARSWHCCTFLVGEQLCGVEAQEVQEVVRAHELTPVPLAPSAIRGLMNLRGQVVTAVDLGRLLGRSERPPSEAAMTVVVRTARGPVGLLVDEIGEVIEVNPDRFEAPPSTIDPASRNFIVGVYELERRLLLVLSIESVVRMDQDGGD